MPARRTTPQLIPTGVPGLDEVLSGGLQERGFTLLQGGPGSGKTTLALQHLLSRAAAGERAMYISLTETRRDLELACLAHGWTFDTITLCDLTRADPSVAPESEASIFHPADIELGELTELIVTEIERASPRHVVFDGVSELRLLAGDPLRYRRQLIALKEFMAERHISTLLLDDLAGQFGQIPADSLVGANIILDSQIPAYGRARRRLLVTKYRGQPFREGYHDYEIVKGGVVVYPRLSTTPAEGATPRAPVSYSSGVPELDAMLGGGITSGSTSLFLGPAGVGKSTVAMQFVVAALERGEKVAAFAFDEVEAMIIDRSEKLCLKRPGGLRRYIETEQLVLRQIDPVEITPGSFASAVRAAVDAGASVILIDSINGYLNAMPEERFLATHLHELFAYLNQRGLVTMAVVAQHGMVASSRSEGDIDVSYLADTVLLFRYFEAKASLLRAFGVLKKRTGIHERALRELRIDTDGLRVGEPLEKFHGVMTGVPEYRGDTALLKARKADA